MLDVDTIPPEIGWYIAGFADGEGSFNVSFRRRRDYSNPWKVSLCFNISQRDITVLELCRQWLRCGTLRQREDGVWYFEVNSFEGALNNVIPFFERFGFLSKKKIRDFACFKQIASLIERKEHLTLEGIKQILNIRAEMNDGGKRRYQDEDILGALENPQRPYAELLVREMIWSELYGDIES